MSKDEINFENALERLEEIVKKLEDGGLSLDRSLEVFTEGIKLIKYCNQELNQAEKRIEMVLNENDVFTDTVPFKQGDELN